MEALPSPTVAPNWSQVGQSPRWELAMAALPPTVAVALHSTTRDGLVEYFQQTGRPDPQADAEWLRSRDWGELTCEQMAPFYGLAQDQYPANLGNRQELIEASLHDLQAWLKRGFLDELPREERLPMCFHLMEQIPAQPSETITGEDSSQWRYPVITTDAFDRVDDVIKAARYDRNEEVGFHVGAEQWTGKFSPPDQPPTTQEALEDYTRYLSMVTHAEGRKSSLRQWNDDHHAYSACNVVYNGLNREPAKVATFERLLSVLGSPWSSFGLTEMSHSLEGHDQRDFENHVLKVYRELRTQSGQSPQDSSQQIAEGKKLEPFLQFSYQCAALKAPGQSLEQSLQACQDLWPKVAGSFPRYGQLEVYAQVAALRQPGEGFQQPLERFLVLNEALRGQGRPLDGLYASKELLKATRDPATEMPALVEQFQRLGADRRAGKQMLSMAVGVRGESEQTADSLKRLVDHYEVLRQAGLEEKAAQQVLATVVAETSGPVVGLSELFQTTVPAAVAAQMPASVVGQLLRTARGKPEAGPEVLKLVEQYSLTGALDGLDRIRERLANDVADGKLKGQVDNLFDEFCKQARLQSLLEPDRGKAVEQAYRALQPVAFADLKLEEDADTISIGGITLDRLSG
ncbi:MAG: hypothetical protein KC910_08220 [Candidatus Eremiobacteraeota bacterium]|nr:hypothetical protein [Candidatus Eremiobacteraeota bacterium]